MNKNLLLVIGIVGFLMLGTLGYFFVTTPQSIIGNGNYVQAPTFYYYECSPASRPVESIHVTLTTGDSKGFITAPSNTDTWDLWVSQTEKQKWYSQDRRIIYQICHETGCDNQVTSNSRYFAPQKGVPSVHIPNLLTTDKVYVNYQSQSLFGSWKDQPNGAEWYQTYKPFILWKVDMFGGGRTEYTSVEQGCNFLNQDKSNLLNKVLNSKKQINSQSSTSNTKLDFYKTRNLIGTYVPISTANVDFVNYAGKEGYCSNRQIFSITTAETNGGTFDIIDSNFNTLLASSLECCPSEKEPTRICGDDFKWKDIAVADCSAFKPCQGNDYEPSTSNSKELIRYNCVEGKCVAQTKKVDCTLTSDCDTNEVCDTKLYKCVDVGVGDVISNITLPDLNCNWYESVKPAKTNSYLGGLINVRKEAKCTTSGWVYFVFLGFLIAIIVLIMILRKRIIGRGK